MYILGIGDVSHDKSVCLVCDGEVIGGVEEERLTRVKHGFRWDTSKYTILELGRHMHGILDQITVAKREQTYSQCVEYCLQTRGLSFDDIDCIVISSLFPNLPFRHRSVFINHHVAHCASAFYPSPFKDAAILVVDGYGVHTEGRSESVMYALGNDVNLQILDTIAGACDFTDEERVLVSERSHMVFSNSLGVFYQNLTILLGLGLYGEGKTMGLSAYGHYNEEFEVLRDYIKFLSNGQLSIDNRGIFLFCKERVAKAKVECSKEQLFQFYADMAFAHQVLLEEMLFYLCKHLYQITRCKRLCLAGGVALNSVANGKIIQNTPFEELFVQPAAGDNGIAVGCAMYGAHALKGLPRHYSRDKMFSPFLGKSYMDDEITEAVKHYDGQLTEKKLSQTVSKVAAQLISEGKIVGWFQGGSEIGPRALGHRSILANPMEHTMQDYLNKHVKHRESFRPYAPAVLVERCSEYFDIVPNDVTPYMLYVVNVRKEKAHCIPAVVHVNGTARLQTVRKQDNPEYYALIQAFDDITGVPVLLNTSFNDVGEPIVETPEDAIRCFLGTKIDVLFINQRLFVKR